MAIVVGTCGVGEIKDETLTAQGFDYLARCRLCPEMMMSFSWARAIQWAHRHQVDNDHF